MLHLTIRLRYGIYIRKQLFKKRFMILCVGTIMIEKTDIGR